MIRVVTEPKVYLVGVNGLDHDGLVGFLEDARVGWRPEEDTHSCEDLAEVAGRLCYMSFKNPRPGGNKAYIKHLLEVGHGSVLEHAVYSLILAGVSRSFTHELVRHRHFSFSQLSQRYVDESDVAFVVPPALIDEVGAGQELIRFYHGDMSLAVKHYEEPHPRNTDAAKAGFRWLVDCRQSLVSYQLTADYLESKFADVPERTARRKAAREAARSVLPNCAETKIFVTGNARAWRGFLDQRATPEADAEMRRAAVAVLDVLRAESSHIFGDYELYEIPGGSRAARTPYRKV